MGVAFTGGAPYGFSALEPLDGFPYETLASGRWVPRLSPESDAHLQSGSPSHRSGDASGVGGGDSPPTPPWARAVKHARRDALAASRPQASLRLERARAAAALQRAADVRAARSGLEAQRDHTRLPRAQARSCSPIHPGHVDRVIAERVAAARRQSALQQTAEARGPLPRSDSGRGGGVASPVARGVPPGGSVPPPTAGDGAAPGASPSPVASGRPCPRPSPKQAGGSGSVGGLSSSRPQSSGASSSPPWVDADVPPSCKGSGTTVITPTEPPTDSGDPRDGRGDTPLGRPGSAGGSSEAARRAAAEAVRPAGEEAREGPRLRAERAAGDARSAAALAEARRAGIEAAAGRAAGAEAARRATAEVKRRAAHGAGSATGRRGGCRTRDRHGPS